MEAQRWVNLRLLRNCYSSAARESNTEPLAFQLETLELIENRWLPQKEGYNFFNEGISHIRDE